MFTRWPLVGPSQFEQPDQRRNQAYDLTKKTECAQINEYASAVHAQ
jgi:hypothetical protein